MALDTNLSAYYNLNWNSNDSLWANNGTDTSVSYVSWQIGNCWSFNGSSSIINISTWLPTSRGVSTHNIWFKKSSATTDYVIMGRWWWSGYYYIFSTNWCNITTPNNSQCNASSHTSPQDTNFHMYTLVQDWTNNANNWKVYIDWTLVSTTAFWFNWLSSWATAHTIWWTNGWFASWLIDEVGIWSRALSSTEITELYNAGAWNTYPFTAGVLTAFFMFFMQ